MSLVPLALPSQKSYKGIIGYGDRTQQRIRLACLGELIMHFVSVPSICMSL